MRFLILGRSVGLNSMFQFLFLFFPILVLCSFIRLKELLPLKNVLTKSLLFFLKTPKIWVGRTTLNRVKKEDGLIALSCVRPLKVSIKTRRLFEKFSLLFMFQRVPQAINDGMRQVQQISQVTLLSWQWIVYVGLIKFWFIQCILSLSRSLFFLGDVLWGMIMFVIGGFCGVDRFVSCVK